MASGSGDTAGSAVLTEADAAEEEEAVIAIAKLILAHAGAKKVEIEL